jgi:hypothetical protein
MSLTKVLRKTSLWTLGRFIRHGVSLTMMHCFRLKGWPSAKAQFQGREELADVIEMYEGGYRFILQWIKLEGLDNTVSLKRQTH